MEWLGIFNELWCPDLLRAEGLGNYGIRPVNLISYNNNNNNNPNIYLVLGHSQSPRPRTPLDPQDPSRHRGAGAWDWGLGRRSGLRPFSSLPLWHTGPQALLDPA